MEHHIVITGATGVIGSVIAERLMEAGYAVVVFSRSPERAELALPGAEAYVKWQPHSSDGDWKGYVDGAKAVIHMAGKPLLEERWTEEHKSECYSSRIDGTRHLVAAVNASRRKPGVLISSSAIGYYGSFERCTDTPPLTEKSPAGSDFLAKICHDWEQEALRVDASVRLVRLRTGIVLSTRGGMLEKLLGPFSFFIGGPVGSGEQCISWIHLEDEVAIILRAIEDDTFTGALNLVSPTPVAMRDFARTLGQVMGRPSLLPVPKVAVQLLMGEGAEYAVKGQKVVPEVLREKGFAFGWPDLSGALADLLRRKI
ncbi:TIGR01777 family oxidoreductase [Prosthecochloris sp. CIB 2401]|uniref:TIGR01777 family oxidoreductase n=1 Tax=Prosthecochloris sp. CIB 2401 TaxID=1868325 RepID=UPI00080AB99E|nr:TIGR01777 family oxidoreductase [Prosthecochloris sp. CIB 2401]ANT63903.1 Epimerase family protein [Prosthecochloris sp. CIB 2401]